MRETAKSMGGVSVAYTYDALDRLLTVDPPGSAKRTYSYDLAGRLTSVTEDDDPSATVTYSYDALDRVVSETSRGLTNTHSYDLSGHPVGTTYSSGASVTRAYNALGLITSLSDDQSRTTTWHYDGAGRARALILPNGQKQRMGSVLEFRISFDNPIAVGHASPMSGSLRIEYEDAVYHVIPAGTAASPSVHSNADRHLLAETLTEACDLTKC